MKTTRTKDGYRVVHNGEVYELLATGQKFNCRGFVGTKKQIKELIEAGHFDGDAIKEGETSDRDAVPAYVANVIHDDLIAQLLLELSWRDAPLGPNLAPRTIELLDLFGWLDESGKQPDVARVERLTAEPKPSPPVAEPDNILSKLGFTS